MLSALRAVCKPGLRQTLARGYAGPGRARPLALCAVVVWYNRSARGVVVAEGRTSLLSPFMPWLVAATALLAAIYVIAVTRSWPEWQADVALSLAANLATALIVFWGVERVLQRETEDRGARFRTAALSTLYLPLQTHADGLMMVYKASAGGPSASRPEQLRRVLGQDFLDALTYFNTMAGSDFGFLGYHDCGVFLATSLYHLREALDRFVDRHGAHVTPEDLIAVMALRDDGLVGWGSVYRRLAEFTSQPEGLFVQPAAMEMLKTHLMYLFKVVDLVNEREEHGVTLVAADWSLWSEDLPPELGVARGETFERFTWTGSGPPPMLDS